MSKLFSEDQSSNIKRPKRYILLLLPLVIILFLVFLLLGDGWYRFLPTIEVEVISARYNESSNKTTEGETLFRAAGWVEASPFLIYATPLVHGAIKKLYIISGQKVKKGDLLAELFDDNYKFALKNAEVQLKELVIQQEEVSLKIKQEKLKIQEIQAAQKSAEAVVETAKNRLKRYKESILTVSKFEQENAEFEYKEKLAVVNEFGFRNEVIMGNIEVLKNENFLIGAQIERQKLLIDKLDLDWRRTKIYSPVDGIIEDVFAREGGGQTLENENNMLTAVASIYDQNKLQIRVDVPLSDVDKISVGGLVKVSFEFLKTPLNGFISAIAGKADYQKNTLEVKVALNEFHELLRTNMLAQVEVLSSIKEKSEVKSNVFIKKSAINSENQVWIVTFDNKAKLKKIVLGKLIMEDWIEVKDGLLVGEKVILNPPINLNENSLVKVKLVQK